MDFNAFEAVIFDFGGVLINIDYQRTINAFKALGIDNFEELYSQASQTDLFNEIETGKISEDEFIKGLSNYLPPGSNREEIIKAWNAMILNVPAISIEIISNLKRHGKKVFLLSNTNEIHIKLAFKRWSEVSESSPQDLFDHVYLSHELGMRKPNPEIFLHVCENESLSPSKTIFIDDSIQHIQGAKSIGLNTLYLEKGMDLQSVFS